MRTRRTLADRYGDKRLNSPNDLVFHSSGDLYFTDPPFGLPGGYDDPNKELPHQGVYRLGRDGVVTLISTDLSAPNGIAFSPDERTLYVSNADARRLFWMAFDVRANGTVGKGRVLFDGTRAFAGRRGTADGMKVDVHGNIFGVGPGGVYVFAPEGTLLGWIDFAGNVGNVAWGEDGSTLFIAANSAVYRVRLSTRGAGWEDAGVERASAKGRLGSPGCSWWSATRSAQFRLRATGSPFAFAVPQEAGSANAGGVRHGRIVKQETSTGGRDDRARRSRPCGVGLTELPRRDSNPRPGD